MFMKFVTYLGGIGALQTCKIFNLLYSIKTTTTTIINASTNKQTNKPHLFHQKSQGGCCMMYLFSFLYRLLLSSQIAVTCKEGKLHHLLSKYNVQEIKVKECCEKVAVLLFVIALLNHIFDSHFY